MYLDVTLPDDAADMRLDKWLDKHMESIRTLEVDTSDWKEVE